MNALLVRGSGLSLVGALLLAQGCASSHETELEARAIESEAMSDSGNADPGVRSGVRSDLFAPLPWPDGTPQRLASGAPGPAYWQQRANYEIEARLDTDRDLVIGRVEILYTNHSPHELDQVWLNLDQNVFDSSSKGARTTPGTSRFVLADTFDGGYEFGDVLVDGEPAELNVYDTVGRIDLDRPLEAFGGEVEIEIEFEVPVPPSGRQGIFESVDGKVYELAHWFPNVAVYDDVFGWNTLPHLGPGEFYTDFGDYRVRLTVPRDHIVAATGTLANPHEVLTLEQRDRLDRAWLSKETVLIRSLEEVGDPASRPGGRGELTWEFVAGDVRTFAFATSAAFVWDAAVGDASGSDVLMQSFYPREAVETWAPSDRVPGATQYGRHAIAFYSDWLGQYPYPQASNVNGAEWGMEYPMIVFCGGRPHEDYAIEETDKALFGVTDHEFGHQWFPMMLSSNERRYAWLDEGVNTFTDHYSNIAYYGDPDGRGRTTTQEIMPRMLDRRNQPIMTEPDRIGSDGLGYLAYGKPGYALTLLRDRVLGETVESSRARFDAGIKAYVRRWAFRHPQPWDFFRTIEDVTGEDLAWFWRAWFYETAVLDQAVGEVTVEEGIATVGLVHAERMVMPVLWEARFDDGSVETGRVPAEAFATGEPGKVLLDVSERGLSSFEIDPDEVMPDIRRGNNRWGG